MDVFYKILMNEELGDGTSRVTVDIRPASPINGFHGATLTFEVPTAALKEAVIERVKWKMKAESGIDVETRDVRARAKDVAIF